MKRILMAAISLFVVSTAMAQTTGELLKFSQYNLGGITARSAAMGGAFTSLGADLSSMSINPAGLAMYNSSEFAFSLGGNIGATRANYGGYNENMVSKFSFTLPNVGAAFKTGNWTWGISWNQLASYNSNMQLDGNYEEFNTSARIWVDQLAGVSQSTLSKPSLAFDLNPVMWNAAMGYESYIMDSESNLYEGGRNDWYGLWDIIDPFDAIASSINKQTSGALNEMVLSGAYNLNNKLYFGFSLGLQSLYYQENSTYSEYNDITTAKGVFDDFHISNSLAIEGAGLNLKVGATVRPVSWLRVGIAYHSPTWMRVDEISNRQMFANYSSVQTTYTSYTKDLVQDYLMQSPERLLVGASVNLSRYGILSFDYERVNYGQMRYNSNINTSGWRQGVLSDDIDNLVDLKSSARGDVDLNSMVKDNYVATNTFKVGLELTPGGGFFARAGYVHSTSPYAEVKSRYMPTSTLANFGAISTWSGGLGYRTGRFNLDLSYSCSSWNSLPNKFFDYVTNNAYDTDYFYDDGSLWEIPAGTEIASFDNINQKNYNHNIIMTFGWRF